MASRSARSAGFIRRSPLKLDPVGQRREFEVFTKVFGVLQFTLNLAANENVISVESSGTRRVVSIRRENACDVEPMRQVEIYAEVFAANEINVSIASNERILNIQDLRDSVHGLRHWVWIERQRRNSK